VHAGRRKRAASTSAGAISVPSRYHVPPYYPTAYRITWDDQAREYRVALAGLTPRQ